MAQLDIDIDLTPDRTLVVTKDNPIRGVRRGDKLIWRCVGNAEGQGLQVLLHNSHPFNGKLSAQQPNQISGVINGSVLGGTVFNYDINDRDGTKLEWADGANTGIIEIMGPP